MVMEMSVNMTRGMNVRPPSTYAYKSARRDMKIGLAKNERKGKERT